jgi:translocation and assembly module TamB
MNDETPLRWDEEQTEAPAPRRRRWLRWLLALLLLFLIAAAGFVLFLDTAPGHRFIADRIERQAPSSGLRIEIGRIEGSIWEDTRIIDLRLSDPGGLFAQSPRVELDWHPLELWNDRLDIDRLAADLVILHRAPTLRPSPEPRPILPGFDIRIGSFGSRSSSLNRLSSASGGWRASLELSTSAPAEPSSACTVGWRAAVIGSHCCWTRSRTETGSISTCG